MGGKHKVTRGKKKKGKVMMSEEVEKAMENKFMNMIKSHGGEELIHH